ncbi:3-oxo-Delta(4,5)-steroid 5-beta-reductase-like [Iris pallida]|uniref:3-oxo-Delta(4,5)-steroid 5-beta-reductase-like n=1 Tax=Iris pallida TaxID=29817 RepID=A0AAX6H0P5_IRIPA|nr:3-oxo-Delta(4,5)-steroid 5-beta-reductase-like [Iris pallida]
MDQYNPSSSHGSVALVVGATGMVGRSLVEGLKKPDASGAPWTVYGLARRRPDPSSTPLPGLDRFIQLDVLDRESALRTLSPLAPRVTHLFWVALAVLDTEEKNVAANTAMLANVVDALASSSSSLRHVAVQTGSKHYYLGLLLDPVEPGRAAGVAGGPVQRGVPPPGAPLLLLCTRGPARGVLRRAGLELDGAQGVPDLRGVEPQLLQHAPDARDVRGDMQARGVLPPRLPGQRVHLASLLRRLRRGAAGRAAGVGRDDGGRRREEPGVQLHQRGRVRVEEPLGGPGGRVRTGFRRPGCRHRDDDDGG